MLRPLPKEAVMAKIPVMKVVRLADKNEIIINVCDFDKKLHKKKAPKKTKASKEVA
jgi:hypothetical protein